ncbi:hypothetical protein BDQ12DRAFT_239064 [Crucibulum laeve]|uniref:SHSP domain-containing protein n=1 Tax=Crucibulum laeve TaxID=68775 RepID=A0A5C3LUI0_9AGAR|nr:hypothetical protein BDQ12DRAFT_239064 [Crucibulum laeve]
MPPSSSTRPPPLSSSHSYSQQQTAQPYASPMVKMPSYSAPPTSYHSPLSSSSSSSPHYSQTPGSSHHSGSSHSSSGQDYFSPYAPSSSSHSPLSPLSESSSSSGSSRHSGGSTPASTPYPVITATVTARNPRTPGPSSHSQSGYPPQGTHGQTPEMLQQFALRIPHPPTLSLAALRHPFSSSNANSSHSPSSPHSPNSPFVSTSSRPHSHSSSSSSSPYPHSHAGGYDLPSPMDRSRRTAPPSSSPHMSISSNPNKHTLSVQLPTSIQPEMVTISANKGDKIKVVADAWHMEDDCHYEWQISFAPHDIDMSAVHAKFDPDGRLTIDVRRLPRYTGYH